MRKENPHVVLDRRKYREKTKIKPVKSIRCILVPGIDGRIADSGNFGVKGQPWLEGSFHGP